MCVPVLFYFIDTNTVIYCNEMSKEINLFIIILLLLYLHI